MDAYVISIIVSFVKFKHHTAVREALVGCMPIEDIDRIMTVDLYSITPHRLSSYIRVHRYDPKLIATLYDVCMTRKIYVTYTVWIYVGCLPKLHAKMDMAIMLDPKAWIVNSPQITSIAEKLTIDEVVQVVPLKNIPYVPDHGTMINQYKYGKYTFKELLEAYITAKKYISKLPDEYNTPNVTDDIYALYCKALRKNLLYKGYNRDLVRRLIIDNDDNIFGDMTYGGMDCVESYIMAHMPKECTVEDIHSAPCELIAKAYLLNRKRA